MSVSLSIRSYEQSYRKQHSIVNKYPEMIVEEVERYKHEMLLYFHSRQVEMNSTSAVSTNQRHHCYTTSLARKTYELEGYDRSESSLTSGTCIHDSQKDASITAAVKGTDSDSRQPFKDLFAEEDPSSSPSFFTENSTSRRKPSENENQRKPFYQAARIPNDLVQSIALQ
jgi:hypothetical protein